MGFALMAADYLGDTCLILTVASPARERGKGASWDMKQVLDSVLAGSGAP